MAHRLSVHSVIENINDDSDWNESDDDLVSQEQEGDMESFLLAEVSDPLERAEQQADLENIHLEVENTIPVPVQQTPISESETTAALAEPDDVESSSSCSQPTVAFTVRQSPGPTVDCSAQSHPYDFFCKIWGEDTFHYIADQTNLYASQKGTATWEEVSEAEIQSFMGIHMAMGIVRLPALRDYWSTNPLLGIPGIVRGMTRTRFMAILHHLHLNDNSSAPERGTPEYDRLYKVRPLFNIIRDNSQASYQPHQELAVDEAMVLFKGRSTLKQYMPMKPTKRGFKLWCACDSHNGYMYNLDVYQGAGEGSDEDGLGAAVVLKLLRPLFNSHHHAYMDNFFSSINLAKRLRDKGISMIGTARTNRKHVHWPDSLKGLKTLEKSMRRGNSKSKVVDGIECVVWIDNKAVALLNNISFPGTMSEVLRRKKDGSRTPIPCPESVQLYNKYMGGVDVFDSRRKTYSCSRKSRKWWLRLFYFLVDASTTNAYILYKETSETKPFTSKEFILQLVEFLLSCNNSRKRPSAQDPPPASRLCESHFVAKLDKHQQCRVCSERRRTIFCCRDCSSTHPVPLCPTQCFKLYHTKLHFSRK